MVLDEHSSFTTHLQEQQVCIDEMSPVQIISSVLWRQDRFATQESSYSLRAVQLAWGHNISLQHEDCLPSMPHVKPLAAVGCRHYERFRTLLLGSVSSAPWPGLTVDNSLQTLHTGRNALCCQCWVRSVHLLCSTASRGVDSVVDRAVETTEVKGKSLKNQQKPLPIATSSVSQWACWVPSEPGTPWLCFHGWCCREVRAL